MTSVRPRFPVRSGQQYRHILEGQNQVDIFTVKGFDGETAEGTMKPETGPLTTSWAAWSASTVAQMTLVYDPEWSVHTIKVNVSGADLTLAQKMLTVGEMLTTGSDIDAERAVLRHASTWGVVAPTGEDAVALVRSAAAGLADPVVATLVETDRSRAR